MQCVVNDESQLSIAEEISHNSKLFTFPIYFFVARGVEMVMHVMQMSDNRRWNETHVTVELDEEASAGHLVRTHRVAHVVGRAISNWRRTITLSRRKRMVAYNIADVSRLFAGMVRRKNVLSRESVDRVFRAEDCALTPSNKIQVEPYLVMAALIGRADAKSFVVNGQGAMLANFPFSI